MKPMITFQIRWTAGGKQQVSKFPASSVSDARRAFDFYNSLAYFAFMKKIVTLFLLLVTIFVAQARVIAHFWSQQEVYNKADIVVVAKPSATHETSEKAGLPDCSNCEVTGLSTDFNISLVMKGDTNLTKLTLHHYREVPLPPNVVEIGAPHLASFDPKSPTSYLLFLHRDDDGRFSPVSGQTDPTMFSIFSLGGHTR